MPEAVPESIPVSSNSAPRQQFGAAVPRDLVQAYARVQLDIDTTYRKLQAVSPDPAQ
jgi:hypothetical protein